MIQGTPYDNEEFKKADQDELASLHQNLHLTYFDERNYKQALYHVDQCINII